MDTVKQQTCEERIADAMASRAEYVGKLQAIGDNVSTEPQAFDGDYQDEQLDSDAAWDRLRELPLGVSVERVLRIELSTGGPADYITAKLERGQYGWELASASYHFADWFDHAERSIDEGSPLWRFAEDYVQLLDDSGDNL